MKQVDAKVRTLTPHPNLFSLDLLWRFGDKPWRRPGPMATAACIVAANAARQRGGDGDSTNRSEVAELRRKQEEKEREEEEEEEARKKMNPVVRLLAELLDIVNSTTVQTLMYIVFVFVFQMLTETLRNPKLEFYFDKLITDTFIENHFDSSHNTFESVRRTADIWEWGNTVLWPGFFANLGPCGGNPGGSLQGPGQKECNDDVWPDGDGSFHMEGAHPHDVAQILDKYGVAVRLSAPPRSPRAVGRVDAQREPVSLLGLHPVHRREEAAQRHLLARRVRRRVVAPADLDQRDIRRRRERGGETLDGDGHRVFLGLCF